MGGELPREYGRTLDPFVALGQAAAVTERLALGTGITLVAQHDPIGLAKQAATLDHLSGGRFTLGVGYGWNVEEAADHGVAWSTRRELGRDRMALMRALWADEPTGYEGAFGSVQPSEAHPKPVQRPRGPVNGPRTLIGGGAGPKLFAHIAEYADGWLPIGGRGAHRVPAGAAGGLGGGRARSGAPPGGAVRGPPRPREARPLRGAGRRGGRAPASPGGRTRGPAGAGRLRRVPVGALPGRARPVRTGAGSPPYAPERGAVRRTRRSAGQPHAWRVRRGGPPCAGRGAAPYAPATSAPRPPSAPVTSPARTAYGGRPCNRGRRQGILNHRDRIRGPGRRAAPRARTGGPPGWGVE